MSDSVDFGDDRFDGTLMRTLGMRMVSHTDCDIEVEMPLAQGVLQPFGYLHGGATIALLETAASFGAEGRIDITRRTPFGTHVDIAHKKGCDHGTVHGFAHLLHETHHSMLWSVTAKDDEGDVISWGTVEIRVVDNS